MAKIILIQLNKKWVSRREDEYNIAYEYLWLGDEEKKVISASSVPAEQKCFLTPGEGGVVI